MSGLAKFLKAPFCLSYFTLSATCTVAVLMVQQQYWILSGSWHVKCRIYAAYPFEMTGVDFIGALF